MDVIGLTGGIGSGKSTVAAMLRLQGATVINADDASRAVVEPGTDGFEAVKR
ncbi:MAG TPA: dephospho-CoA kinase, partial [Candidatus Dormibacteraeota bacterium]|nr:dephospho-CoA kinase [Candidatus Dormibacteraeota bacterium]